MTDQQDNVENGKDLNERQRRALPFLIAPKSIREACRRAGITNETYYTWLEQPAFKTELDRLRDVAMSEGLQLLRDAVTKASDKLVKLLDSKNEETRRRAACNILEYSLKIKEMQELEDRLESIERLVIERRVYR